LWAKITDLSLRYVKTTQTLTVKARTYSYGQGMPDADDHPPSVFADDMLEYERLFAEYSKNK
jgi:hypothetical protein